MQISKSWGNTSYDSYNRVSYSHTGTVLDVISDTRSSLVRTPRGRWRPPTSYSRNVEADCNTLSLTADVKQYAWYGVNTGTYAGANNCSGQWLQAVPSFPASLESNAILKARLNLKSETVSLSQNLGEAGQTARMVVSTCSRLAHAVRAVRHLDPKEAAKALGVSGRNIKSLKAPFDMWLELQYGWKPMLQDVHDATKAVSDAIAGGGPPRRTVISTSKQRDVTFRDIYAINVPCCNVRIRKRTEVEHKCKVRLDYELNNSLIQTASALGLTNPASLAWELLPFSFVADWFIPVGDFLSQLDADFGWTFKGGSCSRKTTVRHKVQSCTVEPDSSGLAVSGYAYGSGGGYQMAFNRTTYGSSPYPDWRVLGNKFSKESDTHVANGIALLTNAFLDHQGRK